MNKYNSTIPMMEYAEVSENIKIVLPKAVQISSAFDSGTAKVFGGWLDMIGRRHETGEGFLCCSCEKNCEEEEYTLIVEENRILVQANGRIGQLRALATLFQMISADAVNIGRYHDAPICTYRGFSLDVSRHFFDCREVMRLIDQAAILKLNRFHFHVSDDRGYRLPSKQFPLLNKIGACRVNADGTEECGCYTEEEIRALVCYANARGIEIIPEIDIPGHALAIIASYPEISCRGEKRNVKVYGGIEKQILCGGSPRTRRFLKELLDEVCDLFPGRYIHLGGDEAPKDEWITCPQCQKRIKEKGFANAEELQADLLNDLANYLKEKGRDVICWNEACVSGKLNKDIIIQYWDELHPTPAMLQETVNGRKVIFSNIQKFYADYGYGLLPLQATYEYEPQIMLQKSLPLQSILGIETTMWTEWIEKTAQLERMLFPRLAASAEASWSKKRVYTDFCDRLAAYENMLDAFGIVYDKAGRHQQTKKEQAENIIADALRLHMIDPKTMNAETAIAHLAGWLQYLQGDYVSVEVREKVFEMIQMRFSAELLRNN